MRPPLWRLVTPCEIFIARSRHRLSEAGCMVRAAVLRTCGGRLFCTAQLLARSRGHWRTIVLGWVPASRRCCWLIPWVPNLVLTHLPLHTATVSSAVASGLRLLFPSRRTRKSHLMGGSLWTRLRVPAPLCRWSCIAKRPNVVGLMLPSIDKTLVKKGLWYLRLQVRSSPKLVNRRRC